MVDIGQDVELQILCSICAKIQKADNIKANARKILRELCERKEVEIIEALSKHL